NWTILHISGFGGSRHGKAKQSRQALFLFPSGGSVLHYDFFALEGRDDCLRPRRPSLHSSLFSGGRPVVSDGRFPLLGVRNRHRLGGGDQPEECVGSLCFARHAARLLFVLPFFQSLMKVGSFDQALSRLLSARAGHLGKLYIRGTFASYLLTVFLFFAAIPIAHDLLKRNLAGISPSLQKKFL